MYLQVYITPVIGNELRAQRMHQEHSLGWLSGELGKSRSFLAAVERGEKVLSISSLEDWLSVLDIIGGQRLRLLQALLESQGKVTLEVPKEKYKMEFLAAVLQALPHIKQRASGELAKLLLGV